MFASAYVVLSLVVSVAAMMTSPDYKALKDSILGTKGLEAGSALHIVNNMTIFYMAGFGFAEINSEANIPGMIVDALINIAYVIFLIVIDKKFHWFDEVKKDDVVIE